MAIKFRQFQKKSHVFDVTRNNFRCTDWRPDCCILYPLHIQEKSRKDSAHAEQTFFTDSKTELGAFFTPEHNTRVNDRIYSPDVEKQYIIIETTTYYTAQH